MMDTRSAFRGFTFWQRFIRSILVAWIFLQIADDLYVVVIDGWKFYKYNTPLSSQFPVSFMTLILGTVTFILIYLVYMFWFVQFILPVRLPEHRFKAFKRLLLFGISLGRWHGPAVFIRNGVVIGTPDEIEKGKPGVAFVDLRSAMTLDNLSDDDSEEFIDESKSPRRVHFSPFKSGPVPARIRVAGPGLTFIKKKEKITGVVDLRPQSRFRPEVSADTRDGIRVTTGINCTFTLGQTPDVLDVCVGGTQNNQVFVIEWEKDVPTGIRRVKQLTQELHPGDEREILTFILKHPDPNTAHSDVSGGHFPFVFDARRVEQAIYSVTNIYDSTKKQSRSKEWFDWPQDVTAENFRILLSQHPYMTLYNPEDPKSNIMKAFGKELSKKVRNTGVLAYRVVSKRDGSSIDEGVTYQTRDLIFFPAKNLNRSDVLRDRGIKMNSAGFGDLKPKDENIRNQLMESWLSSKQKETNMKQADSNLESARIINNARIRSQQGMIYHFTQLLESQESPREALAMLIYQELEAAAANPETRSLLPEDTLSLLTDIGHMLLPTHNDSSDEKPTLPGGEIDHDL